MRHYTLTRDAVVASCGRATATSQPGSAATAAGGAARASERRTAAQAAALLSMGHISSPPPPLQLVIWTEGSRADFPAPPDLNPNKTAFLRRSSASKRGQVTEFTHKSRTRFKRRLATMRRSEIAFTMALTLPGGDISGITHEFVMQAFKILKGRLAAATQFCTVSAFWKRELQQRGVLHYHLILYGLACPALRSAFQSWAVYQWNELMCRGLTDDQKEKHRWWHARAENMEEVRSTDYFVKYVGKTDEQGGLTGRWWGEVNKKALPVSRVEVIELSPKTVVVSARLARKRQQIRANEARHRSISKQCGMMDRGKPIFSLFQITMAATRRSGSDPLRDVIFGIAKLKSVRWGKAKIWKSFHPAPKVVCDPGAPAFANRALVYISEMLGLNLELQTCLAATLSPPSCVTLPSALSAYAANHGSVPKK